METQFRDRHEAGRFLAEKLKHLAGEDVVVLALPRGGVPVAYEVARELHAPLDVFVVRKLGVPIYEELAMGALASGGVRVLNEDIIRRLGINKRMIDAVTAEELRELDRREREYRHGREPVEVSGKVAVLVDDGLATGATMRAAVQALRRRQPRRIVVAVPVGAAETCRQFEGEVDEIICAKRPAAFGAVGMWYADFTPTSDREVCGLIEQSAPLLPHLDSTPLLLRSGNPI
jgi:predicted phosphoribosyltransferase